MVYRIVLVSSLIGAAWAFAADRYPGPSAPYGPDLAREAIAPIEAPFDMPQLERPVFPDRVFDIQDYGAVAGGAQKNTEAFAAAIAACAEAGGGSVVVPPGEWLTGAIHLQSNVNLYLAAASLIVFSDDPEDYLPVVFTRWAGFELYNYSPLIYAKDCENIAITGPGALDGNGAKWWHWFDRQSPTIEGAYDDGLLVDAPVEDRVFATPEAGLRPQFINFVNCHNEHYSRGFASPGRALSGRFT